MRAILVGIAMSYFCSVSHASDLPSFFKEADTFLKTYVQNGSVAYARVKQNSTIENLYRQIGSMSLKGATEAEIKAFYINAYNLIVIYQVSKYYPLKSPLDQSGFFDRVKHPVAGEELTLNSLEIKKLLATYRDARFHFALACAAKSCPPLASFAFTPGELDKQLQARTIAAVNNPNWLKVNAQSKKVELSKIFEWYKKDFQVDGKSELDWVNAFRKEKIPASYTLGYYEYNWELNNQ